MYAVGLFSAHGVMRPWRVRGRCETTHAKDVHRRCQVLRATQMDLGLGLTILDLGLAGAAGTHRMPDYMYALAVQYSTGNVYCTPMM